MLFFMIYAIAAILIYWLDCKLRKKAESKKTEDTEAKPKNSFLDHKNGIRQGIKGMLAFVLIIMGFFVFFMDVLIDDYWLFFGEKRTAYIEERYSIIVDDDIKLKKYTKMFGGPDGPDIRLEFESKIDGLSFMEKNISGVLEAYVQDGIYYQADSKSRKTEFYPTDDYYEIGSASGAYWYRDERGRLIYIRFFEDGDKYIAKIFM